MKERPLQNTFKRYLAKADYPQPVQTFQRGGMRLVVAKGTDKAKKAFLTILLKPDKQKYNLGG